MSYLVLIGDLVASRRAPDRKRLQNQLKALLKKLNARKPQPLSPYTLTLGDEFQAVFDNANRIFIDIVLIMETLHPEQARFSLGLGNITTVLNRKQALGMDGPAFYQAREGIEQLKSSGDLFHLGGLPDNSAPLAEGALRLLSQRIRKWEANRLAILHGLLVDDSRKAIATKLGITEQAVYKNIRDGGLDTVIQVLSTLTRILNDYLAEDKTTE